MIGLAALGGAAALYLLSVGTVDVFAAEAFELGRHQAARLDELTKEAQVVALSILWTPVGVVVLGVDLVARRMELRIAGLVVLAWPPSRSSSSTSRRSMSPTASSHSSCSASC